MGLPGAEESRVPARSRLGCGCGGGGGRGGGGRGGRGGRRGLEDCRSRGVGGGLCCTGLRGLACCFGAGPALLVCGGGRLCFQAGVHTTRVPCLLFVRGCRSSPHRLVAPSSHRLIVSPSHRLMVHHLHACVFAHVFLSGLQRRSGPCCCSPPEAGLSPARGRPVVVVRVPPASARCGQGVAASLPVVQLLPRFPDHP